MQRTDAEVCIVESLDFFDERERKEGEIISRTLRLTGKSPHYSYVRSRLELEAFLEEYKRSKYRYLHLSCHGNKGGFGTTVDFIPAADLLALLSKIKGNRRLFISSCCACTASFGKSLIDKSEWLSVVGPVGKIHHDDAAIFWTSFYHMMFNKNPDSMNNRNIIKNITTCSAVVGEQQFRFIRKSTGGGDAIEELIPEPTDAEPSEIA
jgi:hypothetical protein